ncbi:unnamed protein product [Dracunculus medinensis]|uniref:Fes1 domain-containing protein n=1 Tax=Dracunculus medinensis TaxID=318479 RepID=A0A0N4UI85_DRAME|nr:unnamed protein product [Dracunculus medinensis]
MDENGINNAYWKMILELAQSVVGENNSNHSMKEVKQLDSKDKQFIEKAMQETVRKVDSNMIIASCLRDLRSLMNPSDNDLDFVTNIVNTLEDVICQIDFAYNFCRMGGIEEIMRFMSLPLLSVKESIMRLIPTIAQYNPQAQDYINGSNLLFTLVENLLVADQASAIKYQCLSGISAIVRNHHQSFEYHLLVGGPSSHFWYRVITKPGFEQAKNNDNAPSVGLDKANTFVEPCVYNCEPPTEEEISIVHKLKKFINMNGLNIVLNCYQQALEKHDERVANKAAVIIVGIGFDIGFQEASKHGFTDAIFEIFCTIPPSFDACSYVRGYLNYPELQNMKLTSEMIKAMQDALQSHLDYETTLAEKDENTINELRATLKSFNEVKL